MTEGVNGGTEDFACVYLFIFFASAVAGDLGANCSFG